jgi:membrane-associated protease RseP (regulator of RpoE activity)
MTLIAKEPAPAFPPAAEPPGPPGGPEGENGGKVLRLLAGLALIAAVFLVAGLGDLLLFIVILIVIVMLHELGHFATAKWAGMQVTEYFVGFGPRLWSVRRGETEYGIKAIPAGGYVRITGFTVLDDVAIEDEPRTYRQQPFYKRIIVASAGSVVHFIIAFVLALIVVLAWGVPSNNWNVAALDHWNGVARTPAQLAGLQAGDTIVSLDHKSFGGPSSLHDAIIRSTGTPITLGIEHDGHLSQVTLTPRDGRGITATSPGNPQGQLLAKADAPHAHGSIGVDLEQATQTQSIFRSVGSAAVNLGQATREEVDGVIRTFSLSGLSSVLHQVTNAKAAAHAASNPTTSVRPISVVGIANLGVQAQRAGFESLLELLILVNVIFGLLNMLPMLPLDGGHVAVAAYEWIRTRKGRPYYKADITKMLPVVVVFLAFLAVFVFAGVFLDLTHPIKNVFP